MFCTEGHLSFDISVFPEDEDGMGDVTGVLERWHGVLRQQPSIVVSRVSTPCLQPQLSIPAAPHLSQHLHPEVSSVHC